MMAAALAKTNVIRGSGLEVIRASGASAGGLDALKAYLRASDITLAFSKSKPPKNPGLRAAFKAAAPGQTGLALPSFKRMSKLLVETDEWKPMKQAFPLWSGTLAAYAEPDTPFKRSRMYSRGDNALVYSDPEGRLDCLVYLLSGVPEARLDEPNVILVSEHPHYTIERRGNHFVIDPQAVDALSGFPTRDGWYECDPEHSLPLGKRLGPEDPRTRFRGTDPMVKYLMRICTYGRVGNVPCGGWFDHNRWFLDLFSGPAFRFGVAVEAPAGDAAGARAQG